MDFALLPPEINSGRLYAGPGSGPMLAVAAAWGALAEDLYATANSDQAVISELTSRAWWGPAAAAMANAAEPFVAWTIAAAAHAQQTATQARAAAAAYEAAFAMTVPPAVVAANRSLLEELTATNLLGQNLPAIAATEADYAEMWAQDAAAMYSYAAASVVASTLAPFLAPQPVTRAAGVTAKSNAVADRSSTWAGMANYPAVSSAVSRLLSAARSTLQRLAQGPVPAPTTTAGGVSSLVPTSLLQYLALLTPYSASIATTRLGLQAASFGKPTAGGAATGGDSTSTSELPNLPQPTSPLGLATDGVSAPVAAQRGRAMLTGGLSVPPTWATSASATPLQAIPATASLRSDAATESPTGLLSDMTVAPVVGRPSGGSSAVGRRARTSVAVMVHYPSAG
jgi:PPE-repeat protein